MNLQPFMNPKTIAELSIEELAQHIRPSGFFNIKAKRIKSYIEWFAEYQYDLMLIKKKDKLILRNELLMIHGIGRESADVILLYAFDAPVFVVDAYARRIFQRLGDHVPKSYDEFKIQVERKLPKDLQLFNEYHALLVTHAKEHCKATPICLGCPLFAICEYGGEKARGGGTN